MEKLSLELKEGTQVLELRTGSALPFHELKHLLLKGSLQAPGDFLEIRRNQFPVDKTHILVNEDDGSITINSQDREEVGKITVTGNLTEHPDFKRIGINNQDMLRSPSELATWIKMNRTFFESKTIALNLVTVLRNFRATVNKILEDKKDDRANYSILREQVVNSNLPETFQITVPLFVGEKAVKFDVEIVIDPEDFSCALISPDAADLVRKAKELKLSEQISRFAGYVIIYQ